MMKKICRNCEYFVRKGFSQSSPKWGDCMKPRGHVVEADNDNEERGVFMWDDKTCSDFKPKQKPQ